MQRSRSQRLLSGHPAPTENGRDEGALRKLWDGPPSFRALLARVRGAWIEEEEQTMGIFILGVDLGKTFCSLVGFDGAGPVALRRTIWRSHLMKTIEKLAPEVVAMEACCGAHFVGRFCEALGIEVRLRPSSVGTHAFACLRPSSELWPKTSEPFLMSFFIKRPYGPCSSASRTVSTTSTPATVSVPATKSCPIRPFPASPA